MLTSTLKKLFTRDLTKLKEEISKYNDQAVLWQVEKEIANSGGNLCLHLIGNINAFIGAKLGNTSYVRQRPLEFLTKNVPVKDLLEEIDKTLGIVITTLDKLGPKDLEEEYPLQVFGYKMTVEFFLVHLATHLNYHLGQINYHRRLLDK